MASDALDPLEDFPRFPTLSSLKKTGIGDSTWNAWVETGHLRVFRSRPGGWRRVDREKVRQLLSRLGPEGPDTPTERH